MKEEDKNLKKSNTEYESSGFVLKDLREFLTKGLEMPEDLYRAYKKAVDSYFQTIEKNKNIIPSGIYFTLDEKTSTPVFNIFEKEIIHMLCKLGNPGMLVHLLESMFFSDKSKEKQLLGLSLLPITDIETLDTILDNKTNEVVEEKNSSTKYAIEVTMVFGSMKVTTLYPMHLDVCEKTGKVKDIKINKKFIEAILKIEDEKMYDIFDEYITH